MQMCSDPNLSSAVGFRNKTAGGTRSVLAGKLLFDSRQSMPPDELLAISSTSMGLGTNAKKSLILADPVAALHKAACFLKMFAWLMPL